MCKNQIFIFSIFMLFMSTQATLTCVHVFRKEFLLFYPQSIPTRPSSQEMTLSMENGDEIQGTLYFNPCRSFKIPEQCGIEGEARVVFIPTDYPKHQCFVNNTEGEWEFLLSKDDIGAQKIIAQPEVLTVNNQENSQIEQELEEPNEFTVQYDFVCQPPQKKLSQAQTAQYIASKKQFVITTLSQDSCGIELTMFKTLEEYPIITGAIFAFIGVMFCFFGYKIYKEWLMLFIPLLIVILGFYLYLAYIEKTFTHNSKFYMIIGLLFLVVIAAVLMIIFTNCLYLLLAFLVSYKLGLIIHTTLEKKIEFFLEDYTEWIVVGILFLAFLVLFFKLKNYFVVLCTALLGSSFIILSFHYFRITEMDFLFELEFNKFKDFQNLEPAYLNFIFIFGIMTLIGSLIQIYMFIKKKSKKKEDLNIELNFKN